MGAYLLASARLDLPNEALRSYARRAREIATDFGAIYLARGKPEVIRGDYWPGRDAVLIRFPDMAALGAFLASEEYRAIVPLREAAGDFDIAAFPELPR